jgi:hypothetical protein
MGVLPCYITLGMVIPLVAKVKAHKEFMGEERYIKLGKEKRPILSEINQSHSSSAKAAVTFLT